MIFYERHVRRKRIQLRGEDRICPIQVASVVFDPPRVVQLVHQLDTRRCSAVHEGQHHRRVIVLDVVHHHLGRRQQALDQRLR